MDDDSVLNRYIIDYLLRRGRMDSAKALAESCKLEVSMVMRR